MKHVLLLLCLLAVNSFLSAQSVCYQFDDCGSLTPQQREHTFNLFGNGNTGCLQDWEVVNGTPSIYSTSFTTPYTGTDFALFGIHNNSTTEGAVLKYDFNTGESYTISMALYNYNGVPIQIDFYLLDTSIAYAYNSNVGSTALPAVPAGALKVDSISNFTAQQWQVVSFTVSNLPKNFNRFWIRQYGASSNYLFVDSLCLTRQTANEICYDFDDCGSLTPQQREHTFNLFGNGNLGCLENWEVINGTPSIYSTTFTTPFNGTDFALFGVHNNSTTESAALKHNFDMNKSYSVSMAIYNYTPSIPLNIDFVLLDAAIPYTYNSGVGSTSLPAIPAAAQVAHTISNFNQSGWQMVTFNVAGLVKNFNRLWIRQRGASSNYLFVDHLCISESSPVSVDNLSIESATAIYPNPAQNTLHIASAGIASTCIYDLQGKVVIESGYSKSIDIAHLPVGMYVAEIKVGQSVTYNRFIKQ